MRRPVSLLLSIGAALACTTEPSLPADEPGLAVPGHVGSCGFGIASSQCFVWSADSKTIYAIEAIGQGQVRLVAVDAETRSVQPIGPIEYPGRLEAAAADPAAVYYATSLTGLSYGIHRYSFLNSNAQQLVYDSPVADFKVSPDGKRLAFHPRGSTHLADTIAIIDIGTTTRLASTPHNRRVTLGDFSPDGKSIAFRIETGAIRIWSFETATAPEQLPFYSSSLGYLREVGWTSAGLRGLYTPASSPLSMRDVGFTTGDTITYASIGVYPYMVSWRPVSQSAFVAIPVTGCESNDYCGERHFQLTYAGPSSSRTLGTVNTEYFTSFVPSPDGKWLAYKVLDRPLYLLAR